MKKKPQVKQPSESVSVVVNFFRVALLCQLSSYFKVSSVLLFGEISAKNVIALSSNKNEDY